MASPAVYAFARPFGPRSIVGIVRVAAAPDALIIELLQAGSAGDGVAPAVLAAGAVLRVPYETVRRVFRRGGSLHVVFDPRGPHARMALDGFAETAPELARGLFSRLFSRFDPRSMALLRALETALVARLGLFPLRPLESDDGADLTAIPLETPLRFGTRAALFAVIAALAVSLSVVALRPLAEPVEVPPRVLEARAGLAVAALAIDTSGLIVFPPPPPPCSCARAASPLWDRGIPAVSFLTAPPEGTAPEALAPEDGSVGGFVVASHADADGPARFDMDVAAVNNAARTQRDLRAVLTFAQRDGAGRRVAVHDKGLFWEGGLGAGRAVKWGVSGEGTEVRIDVDQRGFLPDAPPSVGAGKPVRAPAAADAFYELTRARHSVVRFHGATMLAYLRDPRARDAALALGAPSSAETLWQKRILRASTPVMTCAIDQKLGRLRVCVHNASDAAVKIASLEVPESERRFSFEAVAVNAHAGARLEVVADGGEPPRELTAVIVR